MNSWIWYRWLLVGLYLCCGLTLSSCSDDDDDSAAEEPRFRAEVTRTEYGIPHIVADDWAGLGYGLGHAFAEDNFCILMAEVVRANGESARYLGEDGDLSADFVYQFYNTDQRIEDEFLSRQDQQIRDLISGYSAGVNRYLEDTGADNLAIGDDGCRAAEWVRPITDLDVAKVMRKLILRASTDALTKFIVAAQPPAGVSAVKAPVETLPRSIQLQQPLSVPASELGSNAYGVGAEASQTDSGILLGNPHFPWFGIDRMYMSHLTIEGEYDVMGASLYGVPLINIGFNQNLAWTHTVSSAQRFTFYELSLVEGQPLQYHYDDEIRNLVPHTVSALRPGDNGELETVEHTFYLSHFGPVVDLSKEDPLLGGWPSLLGSVLVVRDANLDNHRSFTQWLRIGQANSIDELQQALAIMGIPWVNTIAADRQGSAFYADASVVPHVDQATIDTCVESLFQQGLTDEGNLTLDGSRSECEWGQSDPELGPIFSYQEMPSLRTREYVANANDSYWLANPRQLLQGFSPIIGQEQVPQTLRTRLTFLQAEQRLTGVDGLSAEPGFSLPLITQIFYQNRNYAAELMLSDLSDFCLQQTDWSAYTDQPQLLLDHCRQLSQWDGVVDVDRTGVAFFHAIWYQLRKRDLDQLLWAQPFAADQPIATPSQLNLDDPLAVESIKESLAAAVTYLTEQSITVDALWGDVQYVERLGEKIPIHGGSVDFAFNVAVSKFTEGRGHSEVLGGSSYVQAVTWDSSECPLVSAILTYSQSTDPASAHYADQTQLFADKGWINLPFCREAIEQQRISAQVIEGETLAE